MVPFFRFVAQTLALALSTLNFAHPAHADTITAGLSDLRNASIAGYSVTGTVALNTSGIVTAANLTFNDLNFLNTILPNFNTVVASYAYDGLSQSYITGPGLGTGQIALFFNTTAKSSDFLGLCLNGAQCGTSAAASSTLQIYGFYNGVSNPGLSATNFTTGYLSSVTTPTGSTTLTPEPQALLLIGTSLLGIPFLLKRRTGSAGPHTQALPKSDLAPSFKL